MVNFVSYLPESDGDAKGAQWTKADDLVHEYHISIGSWFKSDYI